MKPTPFPLITAAEQMHIYVTSCTLIGDSLADIQAAHAAGATVIGYANNPYKVDQFTEARPMSSPRTCKPSPTHSPRSSRRAKGSCYRFLYLIKHPAALRSAGRASRLRSGLRSCLRPALPRLHRRPPTVDRPGGHESSTRHARGPRSQTMPPTGDRPAPCGRGRRSRPRAHRGERGGAPIPSTIDPGRAEQTRPMPSRSFVQWRAPPGRHEPRPLHGVWVDGGRDGSWGRCVVEVVRRASSGFGRRHAGPHLCSLRS
ncbi:HAD hydrolase-like protein [Streptomyces sp. PvR006]|uniref:HAD hydrolase-like protein n=1 Tax=Streptomyces sp. PvR006 TaxID=2817860 RepID=UPI001FD9A88B|nr:HAD hydrolase-like protein [Streptomyces sp. PvR006]